MTIEFITYVDNLSDSEKTNFIKNAAITLNRLQKQKQKAVQREIAAPGITLSRSKATTLTANSEKITDQFNEQVDMLKHAINSFY